VDFLSRKLDAVGIRLTRSIKTRGFDTHLNEPVVSFCFDDFPRSAVTEGARMLRSHGWFGTFYAAGGLCGKRVRGIDHFTAEDLQRIHEEGHEIGCHTFSHEPLAHKSKAYVVDEVKRNAEFVDKLLPGYRLSTFAYPFGNVRLPQKIIMSTQYGICRGIWPGLNRRRMDFGELRTIALRPHLPSTAELSMWLDRAQASKAWLIFFTHDVSDDPGPWGYTRRDFADLLDAVAQRGLKVLPMKNAAGLARFLH
jgi:peptidoglycan/xylan/chitin deacetylase (PgdA/CDA1 family)